MIYLNMIQHLMILLMACSTILLQQGAPQSRPERSPDRNDEQGATIRVDTDLVLVDVKVTDRGDGRPVTSLKAEDFIVYEDGKPQQVALFSQNTVPLNVALVLDTSGSTQGEVGLMRNAARRFLAELRPQDKAALVAFDQDIELLTDLTSDRHKIETGLDELEPGSGTAFYDAMVLTVEDVLRRVEGRKAVVVLTDGVDSFGRTTYSPLLPLIERSQASIYFLEVNTRAYTESRLMLDCNNDRHFKLSRKQLKKYGEKFEPDTLWWVTTDYCDLSREQKERATRRLYEMAHGELDEIATRTGGNAYPVQQLKDLVKVFSQIAAELRTQYSIGYYPTNEKHDGQWRSLKVEVKSRGVIARTKPGYRAPRN